MATARWVETAQSFVPYHLATKLSGHERTVAATRGRQFTPWRAPQKKVANDLYGSNVTLTDVTPEMTMSIPFW
jgi:hypothetical protein